MNGYRLGLSLSVVGPRGGLLDQAEWSLAMRITVGTRDEPALEDAPSVVTDTLPWTLWPDALPNLFVCFANSSGQLGTMQCAPAKVQVEDTGFLNALKASVESRGKILAAQNLLLFTFIPELVDVHDTEGTKGQKVPWPGLMQTFSALVPPTPSALKVTWYFKIPRDRIADQLPDGGWKLRAGIRVSAAPILVPGAQNAQHTGNVQLVPGASEVHRHEYSGTSDVVAHCEVLQLEAVLDHGLDEMDNYWLSIRDSRDNSLLDIAHRLEQALQPVAMLGAVVTEKLVSYCEFNEEDNHKRGATATEANKALTEWRKLVANAAKDEAAKHRRAVIEAALTANGDPVDMIEKAYLQEVANFFSSLPTQVSVSLKSGSEDALARQVRAHLLPLIQSEKVLTTLPGEGIELMIGDERLRLRHELQTDYKAIDDVAALQLFGRRSSTLDGVDNQADVGGAPWHPLSAGAYELTDAKPIVRSQDRVLGITAAYVDGVLYREVSYVGANVVCRNPLRGVHREDLGNTEASLMLGQLDRVVPTVSQLLSLPLRYGDYYEFAASVIDRGGGMAPELCDPDTPWQADLGKIPLLVPPQRDRLQFLRRVPVGDCNILPAAGTSWPQISSEVWLRCLEKTGVDANQVPCILLVPKDQDYFTTQLASYEFRVEPPRIDEHTLLRWEMPATNLSDELRTAKVSKLKTQLKKIHARRDVLMTTAQLLSEQDASLAMEASHDDLPFDPAVSAIGLSWRFDSDVEEHIIINADTRKIIVQVGPLVNADPVHFIFTIPQGKYVCFKVFPLVSKDDFYRLDAEALKNQLEPGEWKGTTYRAFHPAILLVETASMEMPKLSSEAVRLSRDQRGDVQVCYKFNANGRPDPLFSNVHQFEIFSERWVWRNLPIPPEDVSAHSDEELRRRLASGPPKEIVSSTPDAPNTELVRYFDILSEIDTGFYERPLVILPFPGEPLSDDIPLYVDAREEVTHADYLRYKLRVRSRYTGVLTKPFTDWTASRRIALSFRGDPSRVKTMKVLAVLPLTQPLPESPLAQVGGDGTPFLVIFDEPWFREYGIGERIEARIATVKREIGETSDPKQLRYGPLPDHSITPPAVTPEPTLDCFGPFGFSLDRTGSQAKANATAFVVYPPAGTPAHYNLFVEFRRLLDLPSGTMMADGVIEHFASKYSEALPVYTLPDSAALMPPNRILKVHEKDGGLVFKSPPLVPFNGAEGDVMQQYRYVLIVGRKVQDGGRNVEVFLPQNALWVTPEANGMSSGRWLSKAPEHSYNAGAFAEILLNGRFPLGSNGRLSSIENLRDLFVALFDASDDEAKGGLDAAGMLRRISDNFDIEQQLNL